MKKRVFGNFVNNIIKNSELIAPVKTDIVRFGKITRPEQVYLKENSYFPLKGYFFRNYEALFEFKHNNISVPKKKLKQRIFFGIRRCDLNSINKQDRVFSYEHNDIYYQAEREKTVLIGLHCNEAEPYCFCGSLKLKDFYDLMFFDKKNYFLVVTGSEKGQKFISKYKRFFKKTDKEISEEDKRINNSDRLNKKEIKQYYEHPDWQKGVDICFSCAACNHLCPSCYCFEIYDEVEIKDLKKGKRIRKWSSCQTKDFTEVAGNYVFREKRIDRFKHRIYHQLQYFEEKHKTHLCTGCGRCIKGCPTRIDWVDILNKM